MILAVAGLLGAGLIGAGSGSVADTRPRDHLGSGHAVATKGETTFEPNSNIHSTLRFGTDRIVVASGDRVRWVDRDADPDPHTVTIVQPSEVAEEYIIPSVFDRRVVETVADGVGEAAGRTGVARRRRRSA